MGPTGQMPPGALVKDLHAAYKGAHEQQYRLWNRVYERLEEVRQARKQLEGEAQELENRAAVIRSRASRTELRKLQEQVSDLNKKIDTYRTVETYLDIVFCEMSEETEALHAQFAIAASEYLFAQTEALILALDALTEPMKP
jgi:predicted nuclease with TOPRIM domain